MRRSKRAALAAACVLACANARPADIPTTVGITEGPPGAHRLTIVSAYSCGYCRVLDTEAMPELRASWLRRGLQLESVPVSISATDGVTAIAATCGDMRGYARRSTILFRAQSDIASNWNGAPEEARTRLGRRPPTQSYPEVARLAGLPSLAPSLGLSWKQLESCLNDPAKRDAQARRERLADLKWNVSGTPTMFLDGRSIGSKWSDARAALVRAFSTGK